jgi:hypothetical protein
MRMRMLKIHVGGAGCGVWSGVTQSKHGWIFIQEAIRRSPPASADWARRYRLVLRIQPGLEVAGYQLRRSYSHHLEHQEFQAKETSTGTPH